MKSEKTNSNLKMLLLALIAMAMWGSLYPFIKIGYATFNINADNIPDILMFAAFRFTICGILVCFLSLIKKEKLEKPFKKSIINITIMGLFAVVLHYAFTYVSLSLADSSKTALLKQVGSLLYVCFAFLFIKEEKFSIYKLLGAIIGFCGIIAINSGISGITFSFGDFMVILASVCLVISFIISRLCVKSSSPYWVTGISQLAGGIILLISGIIMGGNPLIFTFKSTMVFIYICVMSVIGYTLFYYVQKTAMNSKLFIIKFAEPLFACVFSALFLGENILKLQYLISFVLISSGIILGSKNKE